MDIKRGNNFAFIDSTNLYLSIKDQGWKLDYGRFRIYLRDKYHIQEAFIFIGYIKKNADLYLGLKKQGYRLVFKPVVNTESYKPKGNADAELVLHTMIEFNNFDQAVVVTGDGDFYCLVEYLISKNKLLKLFIPNKLRYSSLYRNYMDYIIFMNDLRGKLDLK
jgi:uncharacterized LabA/DUF88 family protein